MHDPNLEYQYFTLDATGDGVIDLVLTGQCASKARSRNGGSGRHARMRTRVAGTERVGTGDCAEPVPGDMCTAARLTRRGGGAAGLQPLAEGGHVVVVANVGEQSAYIGLARPSQLR